ncbi:MAG: hypothetical protein ACK4SY_10600, partial [Pyrobaculum sp.]
SKKASIIVPQTDVKIDRGQDLVIPFYIVATTESPGGLIVGAGITGGLSRGEFIVRVVNHTSVQDGGYVSYVTGYITIPKNKFENNTFLNLLTGRGMEIWVASNNKTLDRIRLSASVSPTRPETVEGPHIALEDRLIIIPLGKDEIEAVEIKKVQLFNLTDNTIRELNKTVIEVWIDKLGDTQILVIKPRAVSNPYMIEVDIKHRLEGWYTQPIYILPK